MCRLDNRDARHLRFFFIIIIIMLGLSQGNLRRILCVFLRLKSLALSNGMVCLECENRRLSNDLDGYEIFYGSV